MKWTYTVSIKRVLHMAWPKVTAGMSRSNAGALCLSYSASVYYSDCMLRNYINPLAKQNYLSVFQLFFIRAARVLDFNRWGNLEPVSTINYLQFVPLREGQTT